MFISSFNKLVTGDKRNNINKNSSALSHECFTKKKKKKNPKRLIVIYTTSLLLYSQLSIISKRCLVLHTNVMNATTAMPNQVNHHAAQTTPQVAL